MIILFGRLWILDSIIADFGGGGGAGVVDCSVVICLVLFERYILIFVWKCLRVNEHWSTDDKGFGGDGCRCYMDSISSNSGVIGYLQSV